MHVLGLMAGKWPHTLAIQPGGVTRAPSERDRLRILASLTAFRRYLEDTVFGAAVEDFAALSSVPALMGWQGGDAGLFLRIAADLNLADLGCGSGRYLSFGAIRWRVATALPPASGMRGAASRHRGDQRGFVA